MVDCSFRLLRRSAASTASAVASTFAMILVVLLLFTTQVLAQPHCTSRLAYTSNVEGTGMDSIELFAALTADWPFGTDPIISVKYQILDRAGNEVACEFQYEVLESHFSTYRSIVTGLAFGEYAACIGVHDTDGCYNRICTPFTFSSGGGVSSTNTPRLTSSSLFPNPANSYIDVSLMGQTFPVVLQVVDMQGRVVMTKRAQQEKVRLNVDRLPAGLYTVNVRDSSEAIRFIKQ